MTQKALQVAYLFQSAGIDLAEDKALQVHMYYIVKGLQQAGHVVRWVVNISGRNVLCTDDVESAHAGNPDPENLANLGWFASKGFRLIESAIRRIQVLLRLPYLALFDSLRMFVACRRELKDFDVLHERYNLCSIGGVLASRHLGIPLVLEVNADMLEEHEYIGRPYKGIRKIYAVWATKLCFHAAARIISVSSDLKEHLVRKWRLPPEKIVVLPNAADIDLFDQAMDPEQTRRELALGKGPLVVFVGGFYCWHDVGLLVESFHNVLQVCPDSRLILIGYGHIWEPIENKIAQLGIGYAVILKGIIAHEHIPRYLCAADVAVAPFESFFPWKGGSALKVFEYMAAGKAIVATSTGQVAEVLRHGHNGLLVSPGDVAGFAGAILYLLNNPAEGARLGRNARQDAIMKHSWGRYIDQLVEIYKEDIRSGLWPIYDE